VNELLRLPWVELSIFAPLLAALWQFARPESFAGERRTAIRAAAFSLGCATVAWFARLWGVERPNSLFEMATGSRAFGLDSFAAPFPAVVAGLHLTAYLATPTSKAMLLRFAPILLGQSLTMAAFAADGFSPLAICLALGVLPPIIEFRRRGRSPRFFAVHSTAFLALLGAAAAFPDGSSTRIWLSIASVGIRCGLFPFHCWIVDLFERLSFTTTLLQTAPALGLLALVRFVVHDAGPNALTVLSGWCAFTALYSGAMAMIQLDARRFLAFVSIALSSLAGAGLSLGLPTPVAGASMFWLAQMVSLTGLGLTLRAVEARVGRLSMSEFHGLFEHVPGLAAFFLLSSLASVGFPGTIGFAGGEVLIDGLIHLHPTLGTMALVATAFVGIAAIRAYFMIFTGCQRFSSMPLGTRSRERAAVLALTLPLLAGGLWPQPIVDARFRAVQQLFHSREVNAPSPVKAAEYVVAQEQS
jgi:NADH-quinone oxidoreductase subunit M